MSPLHAAVQNSRMRFPQTLLGFYFCFLMVLDESHSSTTRGSTQPMTVVRPSSAVLFNDTKFSISQETTT